MPTERKRGEAGRPTIIPKSIQSSHHPGSVSGIVYFWLNIEKFDPSRLTMAVPGFPAPHTQPPYPMAQPGGHVIAHYPNQAPPPGFNVGFNPGKQPVIFQPGPVGHGHAPVPVVHGHAPVPVVHGHAPVPVGRGHAPVPVVHGHAPVPVGRGHAPGPVPGHTPRQAAGQNARQASGKDHRGGISPVPLAAAGVVPIGVPPGLEYLTQIDQILVHQKVELLEAFIGFETNNQYEIKNSLGQKIYSAQERNDCCTRNCCGSLRSFDMTIKDNSDRDVIRVVRPFRCMSCWCPCCLQEMEVQAPPGVTIGYIQQDWHPFLPKLAVQGPNKETVLMLEGPCFACNCCGDVNFDLKALDSDKSIGRTSKQWSGMMREVFTDTDNFSIQFPLDLDVKMKAVLLGACFLIDFMFFEKVGSGTQKSTVFS